jgi:hypothetical protein
VRCSHCVMFQFTCSQTNLTFFFFLGYTTMVRKWSFFASRTGGNSGLWRAGENLWKSHPSWSNQSYRQLWKFIEIEFYLGTKWEFWSLFDQKINCNHKKGEESAGRKVLGWLSKYYTLLNKKKTLQENVSRYVWDRYLRQYRFQDFKWTTIFMW